MSEHLLLVLLKDFERTRITSFTATMAKLLILSNITVCLQSPSPSNSPKCTVFYRLRTMVIVLCPERSMSSSFERKCMELMFFVPVCLFIEVTLEVRGEMTRLGRGRTLIVLKV